MNVWELLAYEDIKLLTHEKTRLGFVGAGNMARALIGGLRARGYTPDQFEVVEPNAAARTMLGEKWGIWATSSPSSQLRNCSAIILAVKPQQMREASMALVHYRGEAAIVSIAAGIRTQDLARWLGAPAAIVRCMPNMPALVGQGITALFATDAANGAQRALAEEILSAVGQTLWLSDESLLDAVTAVSGSGPAYVFYFVEAMERAAIDLGLPQPAAHQLALATFLGSAELLKSSSESAATLRERVTSAGGTTHAALTLLERDSVARSIIRAIHAAAARSAELGTQLGGD